MPLWQTDYLELKLLKKQPMQEHFDPPLSPWKQEINLPCERYPAIPEGEKTSLSSEIENLELRRLYKQSLFLINLLPKAQTSLSC